ncbi:hypothetical protein OLMES_2688 [Oleiphilus messinensis]|uniref:Uncharacterized protein n=1 Tax=Oleiphilus messinensis TaxID=141451 RepID=A0A1Y0I8B9_9GAMM|nr:hypothetical protein OLMES_2688 [Oleiphilus messinensis]
MSREYIATRNVPLSRISAIDGGIELAANAENDNVIKQKVVIKVRIVRLTNMNMNDPTGIAFKRDFAKLKELAF